MPKFKNAKASLIFALLEGRVINLQNCLYEISLSNPAREIPRMVEKPFGLEVSRVAMTGKSRHGSPVSWVDYRLNKSRQTKESLELAWQYVERMMVKPKSNIEPRLYSEQTLFD
jgi:hypothetical protein